MARAVWKGPFVEESLMKKVDKYKDDPKKIPIKTWSRKSTILPDFVGVSFQIYNGKKFRVYTQDDGLSHPWIRTIRKGPNGKIWIGTNFGLSIFDGSKFTKLWSIDGLPNNHDYLVSHQCSIIL